MNFKSYLQLTVEGNLEFMIYVVENPQRSG